MIVMGTTQVHEGGGDSARRFLDHHVTVRGFLVIYEKVIGFARADCGYSGID